MRNCYECGETMEKKNGTFKWIPPNNIHGGPIVIENAEWIQCINCYERMLPAKLNKAIEDEVERRHKMRQDYSANEVKMFTALGWAEYLEMSAIMAPTLYQMAVHKAFVDNLPSSPEIEALRRGFKAIRNCTPFRMTEEFENLVKVI